MIHSRWAMLGVLGLIIPDVLGAPLYMLPELGTERLLPFTIIIVVAFGGLEIYRVQSILQGQDLNSRVYPGGKRFDPLGLAARQQPGRKQASNPGHFGLQYCMSWGISMHLCTCNAESHAICSSCSEHVAMCLCERYKFESCDFIRQHKSRFSVPHAASHSLACAFIHLSLSYS